MNSNTDRVAYENAVLEEIRDKDYAQMYRVGPRLVDTIWITGWPRAGGLKVGDTGKIIYKTGPGYGLHFFIKGN